MDGILISQTAALTFGCISAFLALALVRERRLVRREREEAWKKSASQSLEAERRNQLTLRISSVVGSVLQSTFMLTQILELLSAHFAGSELRLLVYRGKHTFSLLLPQSEQEELIEDPCLIEACSQSGFLNADGRAAALMRLSQSNRQFLYNLPIIHDERFSGALVLSSEEELCIQDQRLLRDLVPTLTAALRNTRLTDRFGKAVDRRVRDHLMAGSSRPTGEIREAGILFVDIVGFTTQTERLPPDQIVGFLNDFFALCQTIISGNDGLINKFLGDGFMAIFGAPQSSADYAEKTLKAGWQIATAAEVINRLARQYGLETPGIALGAEIGSVLAGTVGSEERMEYTLIGDVVNVASRLEGLTRFFGVRFLAGNALREANPDWHFRGLGRIRPKGKIISLNIHEVLGPPGITDPESLRRTEIFEAGLKLYQAGDFARASGLWESLSAEEKNPALDWYRAQAAAYRLKAPADNWDGTETFRTKQ
jgi:class 3 adenylate cyclase